MYSPKNALFNLSSKLLFIVSIIDLFIYFIGTALLVLRGSPGARGLTIDTAAEPGDNPVIDEWGKNDVRILISIVISET